MSVPWYLMAKGKGGGGYKTASGPIVSVNDALAAPLRSLVANIEPVQAGSGDPSPDNVRPISGWSAVNVWRTGKNLLDLSSVRGGTFDTASSFPSNNAATNDYIPVKGGASYVWSQKRYPSSGGRYLRWYDKDYMQIGSSVNIYSQAAYTLTAPLNACYARFLWYQPSPAWQSKDDILADEPMFKLGSTPSAYEPYSGNQYTLQLGDTYYGGTLDVKNGVLRVDKVGKFYDGTEATWNRSSTYNGSFYIATGLPLNQNPGLNTAICTHAVKSSAFPSAYSFGKFGFDGQYSNANFNCWIMPANSTVEEFKTYLAEQAQNGTPIGFVCELTTPITIPLTPQEISTLQGQNNVWADSGNVTVEYLSSGGTDPDLMKLAVAFMGRK